MYISQFAINFHFWRPHAFNLRHNALFHFLASSGCVSICVSRIRAWQRSRKQQWHRIHPIRVYNKNMYKISGWLSVRQRLRRQSSSIPFFPCIFRLQFIFVHTHTHTRAQITFHIIGHSAIVCIVSHSLHIVLAYRCVYRTNVIISLKMPSKSLCAKWNCLQP